MTGSTAARHRISRRMGLVTRRTWPLIQTRDFIFVIVAAITLVDMDATGLNAGLLLQLGDDRPQRVAVERVAMQDFGVQHKLALGLVAGVAIDTLQPNSYCDRDLPLTMHYNSRACSA